MTDQSEKNAVALASIVTFIPLMLLNAWVLTVLWAWFLSPFGIPSIGVAHAIGLSCLWSLLVYRHPNDPVEDLVEFGTRFMIRLIFLGVTLVIAAVARGFM